MVLGVDWLKSNHVVFNCFIKMVIFVSQRNLCSIISEQRESEPDLVMSLLVIVGSVVSYLIIGYVSNVLNTLMRRLFEFGGKGVKFLRSGSL